MIDVMTVGYEGLSLVEFFDLLQRHDVETLVDVRQMPLSRKKGFSKTSLGEAAREQKIGYTHFPALGCPKPIRYAYREDGNWHAYTDRFLKYMKSQDAALRELAATVRRSRCGLLCFEEDYNFCHRKYVAEELVNFLEAPLRISHLTGPVQGRVVVLPSLLAA